MVTERIDIVIRETGARVVQRNIRDIGGTAERSSSLVNGLRGALGLLAGALSVRQVNQYGEAWTMVNNRLALVTDSSQELVIAQNDVFAIAQDTLAPLRETADLYSRFARSADTLSLSQNDLAGITETVTRTLAISGTAAAGQAAALTQLGQAYSGGILRAEEFNSISEQTPRLAQAIADGLGLTIGGLRQLVIAGEADISLVTAALQNQAQVIEQEFSTIAIRPTQAFGVLENSLIRLTGELNELSGQTGTFSGIIIDLSQAIDSGIVQSQFLRQINLWGAAFDQVSGDAEQFGNELILLQDIADGLIDLGQEAFVNFPTNIIAVTRIGAVEVAAFMDRLGINFNTVINSLELRVTTFAQSTAGEFRDLLNAIPSFEIDLPGIGGVSLEIPGLQEVNALYAEITQRVDDTRAAQTSGQEALRQSNELRLDSISLILEERDAIVAAADAEAATFESRRAQLTAETEARRLLRQEAAATAAANMENQAQAQLAAAAAAELNTQLTGAFTDAGTALRGEFSDALAESIANGENFGDTFRAAASSISTSLLSAIIEIGVQQAANFALGETLKATATTSAIAQNGAIATSAAPAAALESAATFGASSVAGAAALTAILALAASAAFADGGMVRGPGTGRSDSIPARLSNGEFVVNAQATRQNRGTLEAINNGQRFQNGGMVGTPPPQVQNDSSQQPAINIVNVTDPRMVEDVLASPAGERTLINVIERNSSAINAVLR